MNGQATTSEQPGTSPPSGQYTSGSGPSGPRAGFWQRFGAALLDSLLLSIINVILILALKTTGNAVAILISLAYYTYLEGGATGQTFGKRALGIRVISFDTGGVIGYARGFIRWIGRILSAIPLFLGYFWMLWDSEKQTWHDKLASAVVVPVSSYPVSR